MKAGLPDGGTLDVGRHRLHRAGPLVEVTLHGDPTLTDMQTFVELYRATIAEEGALLLLLDVRDSPGLPVDARQCLNAFIREHVDVIAGAIFGASYTLRITLNLFSRAVQLLSRRNTRVVFCATEDEARRWLDEQRPILCPKE